MKKHVHTLLAAAVLIGIFTVGIQAQSRSQQRLVVNVPFSFNVGDAELPAGEYSVKVVNPSSDRQVLQIKSLDGKTAALAITSDIQRRSGSKAKIMFRQYKSHYFLAQVWMASDSTGFATPNSRTEKSVREQLGTSVKRSDLVAVNGTIHLR